MREEAEEPNWFSRWEEELPTPEELMPLSQTLITPNLALAFDIPTPNNPNPSPSPNPTPFNLPHPTVTTDFDSGDLNSSGVNSSGTNNGDEPARTLKRPRLVWTPQLHKRFVDAVAHLGIKNAVPKTIMQLMSVDGLTRENVASHLQKYRLYLKRMQGLNAAGGGSSGPMSAADAATDQLFASVPLPHHYASRGVGGVGGGGEAFGPFVPMVALQQQHQQMAVAAAAAAAAAQQQFYQSRNMGQFGGNGGYDNGFLNRGMQRMGPGFQRVGPAPYVDDLEERSGDGGGGRKVLTLFPTGED